MILSVRRKVIIKFVMICPLVLLCISLMTYYTVKYLRNTGKAVEQIADGDFSVRIHKLPRDEIGDISTGVNKMAEKLLVSFSRSQQLRDIYFKYVPVQFMELLGNLEESLECFRKVREADPTDKVVGTYMDYISEKIQTGNTYSNYFRFTKK